MAKKENVLDGNAGESRDAAQVRGGDVEKWEAKVRSEQKKGCSIPLKGWRAGFVDVCTNEGFSCPCFDWSQWKNCPDFPLFVLRFWYRTNLAVTQKNHIFPPISPPLLFFDVFPVLHEAECWLELLYIYHFPSLQVAFFFFASSTVIYCHFFFRVRSTQNYFINPWR